MSDFKNTLCCELLSCGYLDLQSAEDLLEEYEFLYISDVIGETEAIF